jgi:hypothetical protein
MTALLEVSKDPKQVFADAQKAFHLPIGAASPLWLMFAGAASAGVAFWWLNRWRNMTNLEAVLSPSLAAPVALEAAAEPVEAAVLEPAMEAVEAIAPEPRVEVAPEPALDVLLEAAAEPPAVEVAPAPKPKPKAKAAAARAAPRTSSGPTRRS